MQGRPHLFVGYKAKILLDARRCESGVNEVRTRCESRGVVWAAGPPNGACPVPADQAVHRIQLRLSCIHGSIFLLPAGGTILGGLQTVVEKVEVLKKDGLTKLTVLSPPLELAQKLLRPDGDVQCGFDLQYVCTNVPSSLIAELQVRPLVCVCVRARARRSSPSCRCAPIVVGPIGTGERKREAQPADLRPCALLVYRSPRALVAHRPPTCRRTRSSLTPCALAHVPSPMWPRRPRRSASRCFHPRALVFHPPPPEPRGCLRQCDLSSGTRANAPSSLAAPTCPRRSSRSCRPDLLLTLRVWPPQLPLF